MARTLDAAVEELLQDAPPVRPVPPSEKYRVCSSDAHDSSSGYWNTSSSGTPNTRAIWNAISSDGE